MENNEQQPEEIAFNMHQANIIPLPSFKDNYIWVIIDEESRSTLVVDPGDPYPVIDFLEKNNLVLKIIVVTHHHADHVGGLLMLREKYFPEIYGPQHPKITPITSRVKDGDLLSLPPFGELSVLSTPGHTLEHVAYYDNNNGSLFCGDTLFSAGCGRIFEGTFEQMYQSLEKLSALPKTTKIYCAHEYTLSNLLFAKTVEPCNSDIKNAISSIEKESTSSVTLPSLLSFERAVNPFLRCHIHEVIASAENYASRSLTTPENVFSVLRDWKNNFTG